MKRILLNSLIIIFVLLTLSYCGDSIDFEVQDPDDMIVIDGWIENDQFAKVLLTRNTPYFSTLDSASLRELVLTRAKVTLTDGVNNEILTLRKNEDYFPPFIYEGNVIRGETGKEYTITVEYGGKTAFGTTSIPTPVNPDTIFFISNQTSDSLGVIHLEFTDPPGERNYYRILSQVIGEDRRYYSAMIMGISDSFFSGQKFGFTIYRGKESYINVGSNDYFSLGDTVNIKFCTIDKAHYDFWSSFQDEILNTGNPFASSLSVIKSNIQGSGLGIWGGYGVSYNMLIIK